jgi:hypothetical protein
LDRLGRMRFLLSARANRTSPNGREIFILTIAFGLVGVGLTGCGTPGAPQPPSLQLPGLVEDLTAVRAGDSVTLHWTSPRKTTDHLLIKGSIVAHVCRREDSGACQAAGDANVAPGGEGEFRDTLPAGLTNGKPRLLSYFVELKSPKGRSAGRSNAAEILAGAAPAAITGLSAEVRADGVALYWQGAETTPVRLHRRLLTPAALKEKKSGSGLMSVPSEPEQRNLLVDNAPKGTLDSSALFGESYEYAAQRVEKVSTNGKVLELDGEISAPLRVDVIDRFPPAVPQGLAAVAVPEEKTIDLSWQPDSEADLAGYIVYRIASGEAADDKGAWARISGQQPLASPAYRDKAVEPGQIYRYKVSAIDLTGHESAGSTETQESVPNP